MQFFLCFLKKGKGEQLLVVVQYQAHSWTRKSWEQAPRILKSSSPSKNTISQCGYPKIPYQLTKLIRTDTTLDLSQKAEKLIERNAEFVWIKSCTLRFNYGCLFFFRTKYFVFPVRVLIVWSITPHLILVFSVSTLLLRFLIFSFSKIWKDTHPIGGNNVCHICKTQKTFDVVALNIFIDCLTLCKTSPRSLVSLLLVDP